MNWAQEQAASIADAEAKRKTQQEWQMFAAAKAKAEAPALFEKFGAQIATYVQDFNNARQREEIKCEIRPNQIEVIKASPYPSKYVRLTLQTERLTIDVYRRSTSPQFNPLDSYGGYGFGVDRDGNVCIGDNLDVAAVAQDVLRDVFESLRP